MKRYEYAIAGLLVLVGLACLATSGSYLMGFSLDAYVKNFLLLCVWLGIPIVIFGILYRIVIKVKKEKINEFKK